MKTNSARCGIKKGRGHTTHCLDHSQESDHRVKHLSFKQKLLKYLYTYNFIYLCHIAIANIVHTPDQDSDESVQHAVKVPVSLFNLVLPTGCSH